MAQTKPAATKKSTAAKKKNEKPKQVTEPLTPPPPIRREVAAVVFLALGAFCIISYFNTDGAFVAFFSNLIKGLLGYGFWLVAPAFLIIAAVLGFHRGKPVGLRVFCALMLPILFAAMGNLMLYELSEGTFVIGEMTGELFDYGQKMESGGVLGGLIAIGLEKAFSIYGAVPILILSFFACIIKSFNIKLSGLADMINDRPKYDPAMYEETKEAEPVRRTAETKPKKSADVERIPRVEHSTMFNPDVPLGDDDDSELYPLSESRPARKSKQAETEAPASELKSAQKVKARKRQTKAENTVEPAENLPFEETANPVNPDMEDGFIEIPLPRKEEPLKPITISNSISDPPKPKKKINRAVVEAEAKAVEMAISSALPDDGSDYRFPPTSILRCGVSVNTDSRDEILVNKNRLEGAIRSFGINAAIVGFTRGPTVTRYDIELEQGVKLARVTNLAGDLALALGVVNVRIAPIPDKISTVGIEVPNKIVSTVVLRDILESPRFVSAKSKLSFALGKDISGECIVGNIAKLPHMLIAGTTGSGKSVCMNSLILSLLYKARPDEVRFIMIDPKMVELGVYNGIPHLYVPVVTDPKKAAGALQWSVVEMLKRYRLFSEAGVRDLENYNKYLAANGEVSLPRVVIVIDELADLMMVASKEVEESICRVAQMGRAAGMHLVIATQRPSADVITGLMKANIPSRIAFAVSSSMESRIILDQGGAEKLIGMGDMLYSPVGCGKPTRIQGAYVSDEEREEVIQFIKEETEASQQNSEIEEYMNKAASGKDGADNGKNDKDNSPAGDYDEMLPQAVEAVLEMKSCSVSMLQRRIKLGYARAARIVDQMEELGIVGPYEGAKPRSVVIDRAGWHSMQLRLGMAVDDGIDFDSGMDNEEYSDT